MFISDIDTDRIKKAAEGRLLDVIKENVQMARRGSVYYGQCPSCHETNGFEYNEKKNIFKCFKCGFGGNDAVSFYMKLNKTYPEALHELARQFNIIIESPDDKKKSKGKTYCSRMLSESGLTAADVQAKIFHKDENNTTTVSSVFYPGTINSRNEIIDGDDVIIEYYDLEGEPVRYEQILKGKGTGKIKDYFRVRWQYPEEHLDKNGKPFKYKSPTGSGSFIYIPHKIREKYKAGEKIERLFIQEGEKKAEKACKEGIPSVAISGIHNLGRNGVLHEDLVKLIHACGVKELVLLFDSDWNNISTNLGINDYADQRPRSFYTAARNFKEYCVQLRNSRSIYLELYIGYVKENENKDKGVDDLLSNTLKGKEEELAKDIDFLINEKSLSGTYLKLHKITMLNDARIADLWYLNNANDFAKVHQKILKNLPEFRIGKYRWRFNERGEIESAQPIEPEEKYWDEIEKEDRQGNSRTEYRFRYERSFRFLQNRGFFRYEKMDKTFDYIRIEHPFIETIHSHDKIRDFVKDFTREIANEEVLEMLHRGGPQFLGPEKLSNLAFYKPNFEEPRRDRQLFYFKDNYWEVREDGIKENDYTSITHQIWRDQVNDFQAKRTDPLFYVKYADKVYDVTITETGKKCHFLQFLTNTSNFTWRLEQKGEEVTEEENNENKQHLVSKLCAIGYLLLTAKDRSVSRAVVAMDGKQSEVGLSNGRSGKSIIGEMLKNVLPTISINGKHRDIDKDNFLWDELTEKTKIVFIDDVRTNFPFEFLFANITGDWSVNYKGDRRATLSFYESPKIYITTNHALNGEGASFNDRQYKIAFSDYYNDSHKPVDDFGVLFFDEWDFDQWNLMWNLLAECVQLYLRLGVVEAPSERIEQRQLRQSMGEDFLSWADEYFSDENRRNVRLVRREVYDKFLEYAPDQRKFTSASRFKSLIRKYCEWKGYLFNPHKYDALTGLCLFFDKDGRPVDDDKSGGIEYFMLGDPDKWTDPSNVPEISGDVKNELPFTKSDRKEF